MESKFCGFNVKLEKSDEKGMLNVNALLDYLPKAKKAVCEIELSNGFGSGFFCKIPFTENNNFLLPVLITCNHVLPRDLLKSKDYIKIIIDGKSRIISLKERKYWTHEKMDFTCIEIKEKYDDIHTFFNLDDNALCRTISNDDYLNKKVIVFGINQYGKEVGFSNGTIVKNENCFFAYTCNTYPGCSGGCIVNQYNNCIIGIHRGEIENKKKNILNQGIYLRNIIEIIKSSFVRHYFNKYYRKI